MARVVSMRPGPLSADEAARYEEALGLVRVIALDVSQALAWPFEDAYQDGAIGLLRALRNYDESTGVPFAAWARRAVRGAILDGIRRMRPAARRSTLTDEELAYNRDLEQREAAAEYEAVGYSRPRETRRRRRHQEVSLSEFVGFGSEDEAAGLAALPAGLQVGSGESDVLEQGRIFRALEYLPPRWAEAVHLHFYEDYSVSDLAAHFQCGRPRASTMLRHGLDRLRDVLLAGGDDAELVGRVLADRERVA